MTLPLFETVGFIDRSDTHWRVGTPDDANPLLAAHHYLGPLRSGGYELIVLGGPTGGPITSAQVWRRPTSRRLPSDGSWLELSRWCLTPAAGDNAGSRQHKWALRLIRAQLPAVTTLVSYSDPSQGHTGSLYRACNWYWAPTWLRLRPPPSGQGEWTPGVSQAVKDRWIFDVQRDPHRWDVLRIDDPGAIRYWRKNGDEASRRWAGRHPQLGDPK